VKYKTTPIDCKKAAELLKISEQRVRKLCDDQKIEAVKVGNSWIINQDNLSAFGIMSGYILAEDHATYNTLIGSRKKTALSFFSGAMGLDLGIEDAGFDVRLVCEVDKFCRQTISMNRPNTALIGDINDYSVEKIRDYSGLTKNEELDLVVGGPPCQAFSTAGKRNGLNDNRGNVFLKYLDIAIGLQPKVIVIENVRGLLSCPMQHRPHEQRGNRFSNIEFDELEGGALNFILEKLRNSGYAYSFNLYNAANFGTPQIRERVVIVCTRDTEKIPYLVPTHSENGDYSLEKWKTFRESIKDIEKHHHIDFPESRLKYYRMIKAGYNWRSLPIEVQKEALGKSFYAGGGKTGFLRRLAWDKPSPTVVTHPAMPATDLAHPEEDRPLSIEEYKRIQEFPDNWYLSGPLVQQYKQVGNAVPKSLGKAIGKLVYSLIEGDKVEEYINFPYSRYKRTSNQEWESDFSRMVEKINSKMSQAELTLC
jgi:DNA (cytosine-5)-methyltransferase 1